MSYVLPTLCIRFFPAAPFHLAVYHATEEIEFKTYYTAAYVVNIPAAVTEDELMEVIQPLSTNLEMGILVLHGHATNPFPTTWGDGHPDVDTFRISPRTLVAAIGYLAKVVEGHCLEDETLAVSTL